MGVTGVSITLANSIIGVGILAMPFCFQQCGIILATLILIVMGLVSRLCCYFLLKSAILTRRRNYEFLAFHVFGTAGKTAIEMGIIGFLMGTCVAYFVVVGDLGPQIIAKMFNINQSDILRTSIMVIVSLVCVLPLGLLRNVESFSNVSAATIAFYLCLVVKVIAEATSQMVSRDWTSHIELWKPAGVLQCVPIFSMALFCQTQLFEIFESWPNASLDKMCLVTKNAINICSAVYFTLGVFGYIAFGSQEISGNVLVSLSPTMASDVIKLGFVMSLAFSFPLIIFPCRESLYSFFYRTAHGQGDRSVMPARAFRSLTLLIVLSSLCCGVALPAVERVLGLLGASAGSLVCVVFPAALALRQSRGGRDAALARLALVLGLLVLLLGTYANMRDDRPKPPADGVNIDRIVEDFFQKMEKAEGAIAKPPARDDPSHIKVNELKDQVAKDSEIQPPNPVPPESHSNERAPPPVLLENSKLLQQVLSQRDNNKLSESHPRNIELKLNGEKTANGVKKNEAPNAKDKAEKPKDKPQSSQEKLDMIKQQQLIETIKQHGEEQRELIKEQKEILDEIKKTKDELKKNKEDADTNEAKKIAVESIQKIANVAIKSLVGDSDSNKPKDNGDLKPAEPIENIVNKAVSDIAKRAEETLDAIKKKDEPKDDKYDESKINKNDKLIEKLDKPINDGIKNQKIPLSGQNTLENKSIKREVPKSNNIKEEEYKNNNKIQESSNNHKDVNQNGQVVENVKTKEHIHKPDEPQSYKQGYKNNNKIQESSNNHKDVNQNGQVVENVKTKEHIHKPDEPQSYKQGEDVQKDVQQNVPNANIPLDVLKITDDKINKIVDNRNENIQNGAIVYKETNILKDIANGNIIPRRKREVVDCTEEMLLKAEDKQICLNLVNKQEVKNQDVFLKDVNLGDVGLSNSLPLQAMALHHIRTLKNFEEDKKR